MTAQCHYCVKGDVLDAICLDVCKLSVSTLYLLREQSHPGRCIVTYDEHVGDITDLSDEQRDAFFADTVRASRAIKSVFNPDKVNYGAYGDLMRHLHFHLVPKYRDGFEWGDVFAMNPKKIFLSDAEYADMIASLRKAIAEGK